MRPTIVIDFDGVIHSYEKGWQDGHIYGTPVSGFFEWAEEAKQHFTLAVYSSRSDSHKNLKPMRDWFSVQLQAWRWDHPHSDLTILDFDFPLRKPPAWVSIDDRVIRFNGRWDAEELKPINLAQFRPWTQKGNDNEASTDIQTART